jgi:hypothetical protein
MFFFSQQFFREVLGLAADFPVFPREIFACGANQRNSAFPHFPHRSGVYKTVYLMFSSNVLKFIV